MIRLCFLSTLLMRWTSKDSFSEAFTVAHRPQLAKTMQLRGRTSPNNDDAAKNGASQSIRHGDEQNPQDSLKKEPSPSKKTESMPRRNKRSPSGPKKGQNRKRKNGLAAAPQPASKSPLPTCNCKLPALLQTVRKEGPNHGRQFWGCRNWAQKGCKFFEWQDPAESKEPSKPTRTPSTALSIKVMTMNVAEFKRHHNAPSDFQPEKVFREEVKQHQPDILAVQELPRSFQSTFQNYKCVGMVPSHCGNVGLFLYEKFIRQHEVSSLKRVSVVPDLPVVLGSLTLKDGKELVIGSCHLPPFKEGAPDRLANLNSIAGASQKESTMILAGDMNMRQAEDEAVEAVGGWKDAWKESGSNPTEAYSWNSRINHYHGPGAFQFACRFDRIYVRNHEGVDAFGLMANTAKTEIAENRKYFLSDHFGIAATVLL